eukprot:TRINITY_DN1031_c0_g1_i3.p1 TRINITY_DN1031_c0_g1~~TRINITY_DN1031_c0_g1_i3.p1  ORF type:complete len:420 (-),score=85.09 TRINITY_DN1031_c0_g1_i3:210-1439(-)
MSDSKVKTPITVVTGFLGAGKTTLVNHILKGEHGKKIAVIENEFGEVGIDDALVLETKEEIFEMNNGCVCCTVRGDLIRILSKLMKRKNKFDAVLIETTGLADPGPVIQTFFMDDGIKEAMQLDAILTVVDAKHVSHHLDEKKPDGVVNEAIEQVAFADKILLNKTDLVGDDEKKELISRLKGINAGAQIIECQFSKVDLDKLLGINAFNLDRLMEKDANFLVADSKAQEANGNDHEHDHDHDHDHNHGHDHDCKHEHCEHPEHDHSHDHDCTKEHCDHSDHDHNGHKHSHKHDDHVTSVGMQFEGEMDFYKVNKYLNELLQAKGNDLYRSKGILAFQGSDDKFVFQGVHMQMDMRSSAEGVGRPWAEGETRVNKFVFIGKDLNRQELEEGFKACIWTGEQDEGSEVQN